MNNHTIYAIYLAYFFWSNLADILWLLPLEHWGFQHKGPVSLTWLYLLYYFICDYIWVWIQILVRISPRSPEWLNRRQNLNNGHKSKLGLLLSLLQHAPWLFLVLFLLLFMIIRSGKACGPEQLRELAVCVCACLHSLQCLQSTEAFLNLSNEISPHWLACSLVWLETRIIVTATEGEGQEYKSPLEERSQQEMIAITTVEN